MNGDFERYHCQMALPEFGERGQAMLQAARVLIVGAGGLGCPAAQYLAAAGIGTIIIADDDVVALSNLHRQILYTPQDVGRPKVEVACKKLQEQNPSIEIIPYEIRITDSNVMEIISSVDLVIEGTDNFETKLLLNDACVLSGKALVYGAIYQYEGQVAVWNVLQQDGTRSSNYRDVFPDAAKSRVPNCAEGGVISTLAGVIGCMQANEAIKYLTDSPDGLAGKLWMINMLNGETRVIHLQRQTEVKITHLPVSVDLITWAKLQKGLEKGDLELIDVRTESEYRSFNAGGKNIPLDTLDSHVDNMCFTKPVVCCCTSGVRSAEAARLIRRKHPEAIVYSLKGGLSKIPVE